MKYILSSLQYFWVTLQSDFSIPPLEKPHILSRIKQLLPRRFNGSKGFFNLSNKTPFILLALVVGLIIFFGLQRSLSQSTTDAVSQDERTNINAPLQKQSIDKSFSFPLREQDGKEVSQLIYLVESVEVRDQIIVKGQRATVIQGRRFLIVNIKLTNNFDKTINVNAKDYLRVIINGSSEKLAPDMHSDPVEVQPISTKFTRLGMTINDTDKKITLQVGEISGKKEDIHITLK